jgi:hypothetical protein
MAETIICYLLLAIGLGLCLFLFCTLKSEIVAGRRKQAALQAAVARLTAELAAKREDGIERTAEPPPAPAPFRCTLNLSTRSQALRMSRRGDATQQIAAALGVPEKEVELLLKVQRIGAEAARAALTESETSPRRPSGIGKPAAAGS